MVQCRALGFVLLLLTPLLVRFAIISDYVIRYEHYATVLCENLDKPELSCNGKCAMMQNLQEAENDDLPTAPPIPKLKVQDLPFDFLPNSYPFNFQDSQKSQYPDVIWVKIPHPFLVKEDKPPTVYVSLFLA